MYQLVGGFIEFRKRNTGDLRDVIGGKTMVVQRPAVDGYADAERQEEKRDTDTEKDPGDERYDMVFHTTIVP